MKIVEDDIKKYQGNILKVRLENGNFLRGRFMEGVKLARGYAIVIQSNTYTFQIEDKDIAEIDIIAEKRF